MEMFPPRWGSRGPALVIEGLLWGDVPKRILSADSKLHISTVHQGEAWLPRSTRISVVRPSGEPMPVFLFLFPDRNHFPVRLCFSQEPRLQSEIAPR